MLEGNVGGIDPAFHRQAAARADIQRDGLPDLHVRVGAREPELLPRVFHLKRLADRAGGKFKPADQRAVVAQNLGVSAVRGVAFAAPPAGDAGAAIVIRERVPFPGRHRHGPVEGAHCQRQEIGARLRGVRVGDDRHLIVGQAHQVGADQGVGEQIPAAEGVKDIRRREIIPAGGQLKIAEGEVGSIVQ